MRLVEDHRVAPGQQIGETLVLEHDVGEEQMVIDHDDVRGERIPACLHDEALCVVRAFATEAILAGRRHLAPNAGIVGHVGELGLVSAFGVAGEGLDSLEITNVGARREAVLQPGALEMIVADIIRPALEQCDGDRDLECVADQGQVTAEKLVLKRLRPGRHDDLAAREQRRDQIREGLAGSGAGFGDELTTFANRAGDRFGHRQLFGPQPVRGKLACERTVRAEYPGEVDRHADAAAGLACPAAALRRRSKRCVAQGLVFLPLEAGAFLAAGAALAGTSARARMALIRSLKSA